VYPASLLDLRVARLALAGALMAIAVLAALAYAGSLGARPVAANGGGEIVLPVEPDGGIGGEIVLPVEPDGGIGD
jgi:hypothetical protein